MSTVTCGVCRAQLAKLVNQRGSIVDFQCVRCGRFSMWGAANAHWEQLSLTPRQIANASGWVREQRGAEIEERDCHWLADIRTPGVVDRADKLLLELERRTRRTGGRVHITKDPDWLGVSWSTEPAEIEYLLLDYLRDERDFISVVVYTGENLRLPAEVKITPKGYAHLDGLRQSGRESSLAFCAMWFDPAVTMAWVDGIRPAIAAAGYEPRRLDKYEHNNRVDDEVIATIRSSRFVVADLTGQRGGVYFEAGFALGLGLPVVWTVDERDADTIHFDNRQYNFIRWNSTALEDFRNRLTNRIEATLGRGPLKS